MRKKIDLFWYWFIFVVAFVLCFFVVNDKKINAYHLDEEGNLVSKNLFNFEEYSTCGWQWNVNCSIDYDTLSISSSSTTSQYEYSRFVVFTKNLMSTMSQNATYTFSVSFTGDYLRLSLFTGSNNVILHGANGTNFITFNTGTYSDLRLGLYLQGDANTSATITDLQLELGNVKSVYEPFGIWYNESLVGDLATGVISYSSSSVIYENTDDGNSYTLNDVSSYIDSSFGFLYFDRLWNYLDNISGSSYDNAWLTLTLNNKMNLNTTYILNAMYNNGNYGVGVKFYQGDTLILNVTNWVNNDYAYCNEISGATCSVQLSRFVNVGDFPSEQNSFTYFDKIEIWSGDTDKRTGSFGFQNISYNQGYNSGYNIGYNNGSLNGENIGYNNGYGKGYLYGYEKGVESVQGTDNTLVGMVGTILTAPVNMLQEIFNFEFLGINLTNFIFSVLSLFIVIWLIKIFL